MSAAEPARPLADFRGTNAPAGWEIVNDDVMGGISRSRFVAGTNAAVFAGEVSLENNGGFASVRERPVLRSLAGCDAFVVRVRGDGRRYKFTARTDRSWDGVVYQAAFTPKAGEWTEQRVPFRELVPTFRGRVLTDVPAFDPARFVSAGVLISDRQAGPFRLELEWLRAEPSP